jgi:hypothetical protein
MSCKQWKEEWVAHLYDELEPVEERALEEHLSSCESCRNRMEHLAATRQMLRDACPTVPATPSVVVLRPRRLLQPLWTFAAGAAAASLIFALGLVAGINVPGAQPAGAVAQAGDAPRGTELVMPVASQEQMQAQLDFLLDRVEELGQVPPHDPAVQNAFLTRSQLDEELRRMEQQAELERSRDFGFLLEEIAAAEMRTGAYLDDTRRALQVVAVKNDPRFRER